LRLSSHCPEIRSDSIWLLGLDGILNLQNKKVKSFFAYPYIVPFVSCICSAPLAHFSALHAIDIPLYIFYLLYFVHFCLLIQPEHMLANLRVLLQEKYQSI